MDQLVKGQLRVLNLRASVLYYAPDFVHVFLLQGLLRLRQVFSDWTNKAGISHPFNLRFLLRLPGRSQVKFLAGR